MDTSSAYKGRTTVRLSQVPRELRELIAEEYVEKTDLPFDRAVAMRTLAVEPRQDPVISVPTEKWLAVRQGRRPKGDSIYRWLEGL